MHILKKLGLSSVLVVAAIPMLLPTEKALATTVSPDATLIARGGMGKFGKWLWKAGQRVFVTVTGIVISSGTEQAVGVVGDSIRERQLAERHKLLTQRIHQEEYRFHQTYGQPIPVNEHNVDLLMSRVGATPSEREFVTQRMRLYWES